MIETICNIGMVINWVVITNMPVIGRFIQDIYDFFHREND